VPRIRSGWRPTMSTGPGAKRSGAWKVGGSAAGRRSPLPRMNLF